MALPDRPAFCWLAALAGSSLTVAFPLLEARHLLLALAGLFLATSLVVLFRVTDIKRAGGELALLVAGYLYIPMLLGYLILVKQLEFGSDWLFLLLLTVMGSDTAAFYLGCAFGRHKLYPLVSPNKSVEGAVAGLAGSLVGAFVARLTFFPELGMGACVGAAFLLGMLGQLGDLFESLLKRSFGVKDSGAIVPGHGGILDRLDSILFAAPALYGYAIFVSFWQ